MNETNEAELKVCPCCSSCLPQFQYEGGYFSVICPDCGLATGFFTNKNIPAKIWNTRHQPKPSIRSSAAIIYCEKCDGIKGVTTIGDPCKCNTNHQRSSEQVPNLIPDWHEKSDYLNNLLDKSEAEIAALKAKLGAAKYCVKWCREVSGHLILGEYRPDTIKDQYGGIRDHCDEALAKMEEV